MQLFTSKPRAVSIVELIVAMTIFLVIITTGLILVSQVSKAAKKVEMEEYLATEGQALMERITREIQTNAIDYEEYYSHYVIEGTTIPYTYGTNYGDYHKQFFHPGYATTNPSQTAGPETDGYGAWCINGASLANDPTCTPNIDTFDFETGTHPYSNNNTPTPENANAVCETSGCSTTPALHEQNELYLINKEGTRKLIIALENDPSSSLNALSMVELTGTDNDNNGLIDTWTCATGYTCTGTGGLPTSADLTDGFGDTNDFLPYSPSNLAIQWIKFYISPLEDPFKGYNETTSDVFQSVQQQPRVTIVMNAKYQLYDNTGAPIDFSRNVDYIGNPPEITFQTTIGTGVNQEIPAYSFP